jgi:hypothetical protein
MEKETDLLIFGGTQAQAERIYKEMAGYGLREAEQFILLRYLGLPIPPELEKCWDMSDDFYRRIRTSLLRRLPEEAVRLVA